VIRIKQVMAIARAQRLINLRLVRYWVFVSFTFYIALHFYLEFFYFHSALSSYSGSVGAISPRFLISIIGMLYSAVFLVGTVFLAFDVRARDIRERVIEVLDSKPISNLELIAGKFTGIFLSSWIPMAVLAIFIQVVNLILKGLNIPVAETIEIFSLFTFLFIMAVPALSFVIALVFFITLLVRNRLAATIILLFLIISSYWAALNLPLATGMLFDIIGISCMDFASDILPHLATAAGWLQRLSVLFAAFSLLGFSAVIHPRLESGSRKKLAAGSFIVMIAALLLAGGVYSKNTGDLKIMETWKQAHAAVSNEILPDLKKIFGDVKIDPGKALYLDLDITFGATNGHSLEKALFTLNPGQEVKSITDSSGKPISFTHENGLLEIGLPNPLEHGEEITVHVTVQGKPDNRFAFLFSDTNPLTVKLLQVRVLIVGVAHGIFGTEAGLFDKSFVALMPGLRWLPASGSEKERDDHTVRPVDYFDLDLKVDLPDGWLAAGPGLRHKAESNNDGASFRFSPPAPIPESALIASRFESRSMDVEGITLEVLIDKKHIKNLNLFADTKENIREWLSNHLREVKDYDLGYPYDAITLVEVPNTLRCYGGGWRMDTTMAPPGIVLMREIGFPTANFTNAFKKLKVDKHNGEGIQQAKFARLRLFFNNDFSGGNILAGGSKNFFLYQTAAKGPEALALNYIMENLSNQLVTETKSFYSAHQLLKDNGLQRAVFMSARFYSFNRSGKTSMVDTAKEDAVSKPEVWDKALGVSLKDMDPWEDPARTINVLGLKADAIAQSILDTLGYEKTGKLLASIRQTHKGKSFILNDVLEAGKVLGYDLTESLGDMLTGTDLAGFVCEDAEAYRIADSEDGNPRYQMLFTIRNDEPVSGSFRFACEESGDKFIPSPVRVSNNMVIPPDRRNITKSRPIHLKGKSIIKYGTIVSKPPVSVSLEPYLSLNRYSFLLPLKKPDEKISRNIEPIEGVVELPYTMPREKSITIDDLDPGFSITEVLTDNGTRISAKKQKYKTTDQGLPIGVDYRFPPVWSRLEKPESYGKYRHTLTAVRAGKGEQKAVFTAPMKKAGQCDLKLYIPEKSRVYPMKKWGTYNLVIKKGNGEKQEVTFDSKAVQQGWNLVGRFDITEGDTTVTISNKTDGDFVVADAIRWTPFFNE
jgi:ABC-type transport system involved in multi-copper enzyme maturation permease subunit